VHSVLKRAPANGRWQAVSPQHWLHHPASCCVRCYCAIANATQCVSKCADLDGYELTSEEQRRLQRELTAAGRDALLLHVREAAHTALSRLKDRCQSVTASSCKL